MNLQNAVESEDVIIERAGIIPFALDEDGKVVMLFMKPSDPTYGGTEWQIAKGGIDPGEKPINAAIREGKEELGLLKNNIKKIYPALNEKNLSVFCCSIKDKNKFTKPHFETKSTKWLNWGQIYSQGRRWQIKYIAAAYRIAKKELGV